MADLSNLSDAELQALYAGGGAAAPVSPLAGMSDEALKAAYANSHPIAGPSGSTGTDLARAAGTVGANVLGGLLSLPRTVASGVDWVGQHTVGNPGAEAALASVKEPGSDRQLFPDFQTARNMAFNTTGGTEYQPQTWLGRRAMDAATGAAMGLTGGVGAIAPAAAGAATSGAAAEMFPDHPLAASLLGFIPGAALGKAAVTAPQRLANAITGANPSEPYAAFVRQGLPTNLAGTSTGAPGATFAEKFAARMPGSEEAIAHARGNLLSAWQDRLGQVADRMGTAATAQEAGQSLQTAARDWLNKFKTDTGQLWNDFYAKVPGNTPVGVSNYQQALGNVLGNFSGAPATGAVLQPGTVQSLSKALGVDLQNGSTLPWDALKNIRTSIGEKLNNPQTIADTSQAALKQLYAGLTRDMEAGAGGVSQQALSAFHKANAATAAGHDLLESQLNPILTANSPEAAAQYAMGQARAGGTRLGALTFNLPSAAGDLGSYALRNAATNTESPTALATALTGRKPIYSPEAQRVLFPNAATQGDIADLATVGKAMQPFEKDLANSPTATHQARGLGRLITAIEMSKEGHELAGMPGRVGGLALGLMAPNVMGRVAQATALNPWMSALYGHAIPLEPQSPSLLARAMMAPALSQQVPAPALAPATFASSPQ